MNTFNRNTLALVAVSALHIAFFAATAHAGEAPVARVNYTDLNLDTAAGAKVLYQRLQNAAEQVCGGADSRQLALAAAAQDCADRAIVNGVQAVNSEQLARIARAHGYEVHTGFNVAAR